MDIPEVLARNLKSGKICNLTEGVCGSTFGFYYGLVGWPESRIFFGMPGMIERVARALAKEEGYAYDPLPYNARARAAIEAMREPTEAMVDAGADADGEEVGCVGITKAREVYGLMIDAALK